MPIILAIVSLPYYGTFGYPKTSKELRNYYLFSKFLYLVLLERSFRILQLFFVAFFHPSLTNDPKFKLKNSKDTFCPQIHPQTNNYKSTIQYFHHTQSTFQSLSSKVVARCLKIFT